MIDLQEVSGLPIRVDLETGTFYFDEDVGCDDEMTVVISEMSQVLLNRYIKYPEKVYKLQRNIYFKAKERRPENIIFDLIFIPYGLLGIEFIKTHIFFSEYVEGKIDSVVEVYSGELTALIQKNREKEDPFEFETHVDDIHIIKLTSGQKLAIPTGAYYTFINTGADSVVFSKISSHGSSQVNYSDLSRERGLACYIIAKNARTEIVANPKYKVHCKISRRTGPEQVDDYNEEVTSSSECVCRKIPLYRMLVETPEVFTSVIM